jgi:hypothetical protein
VVPEMTLALAAVPFDAGTRKGFGCGNCHRLRE